jgi:hypothetical protein
MKALLHIIYAATSTVSFLPTHQSSIHHHTLMQF